jgi:hypothetical protein
MGGVVYETNIPDGALSGSAIALKPTGGTNADQELLIYPTVNDANHLHLTTGNLYNTELFLGDDNLYVKLANTGNVVINSNDDTGNTAQWTFGTTGNLTLPGNTFAVNYANGTPVSIGGGSANTGNVTFNDQAVVGTGDQVGSSGLYLAPGTESVGNLQYIRVRGGDVATHIHLDTGNNAYFDQYFGSDIKYVKLEAAGNVQIGSNDDTGNSASWTFGVDGNLTVPGDLVIAGNTSVYGTDASLIQTTDGRPLLSLSSGSNGGVSSLWVEDIGNIGTSNIAAVYVNPVPGSGNVRIAVGANGNAGPNLWDFDHIGKLTLPGGSQIRPLGANLDIFAGTGSYVNLITSDESSSMGVDNGGGYVTTAGGTWDFGTTGNLTAPGNVSAVGNVTAGNLIATGNVSGNFFIGNGSQLTGINNSFAGEMHVSKNGNDSTGTGNILQPYLTITHALTQVAGGRNTVVIHPGTYTENPTITNQATQLITYDATGASTLVAGTVTIANVTGRIAGLKMTNLAITGNAQAYINSSTVDEQFTKSSSGYVEVDDCELQVTGNVLISGSGSISIIGNKINNLVVNNAGAGVLVKGADDCVMPQVTAGSLNIVDSVIRASSNTANAVTASAGTVVTLMNNQIVTPAADNVARVSIAGYHSIISLVYDKANSTLSNSLNSVVYFQTANVDSLVSSGNVTGGNILTAGIVSATGNITGNYILGNGSQLTGLPATYGNANVATFLAAYGSNTLSTTGNIASGNVSTGKITLTNGAVIQDTAGDSVAFGDNAGLISQGNQSVAIGYFAGRASQGANAVAVGINAGASSQGTYSVAIGSGSGAVNQGYNSVAIGHNAGDGTQGNTAIAIGYLAGHNNQLDNTIILNASGTTLDSATANALYINPVRNDVANTGQVMFYNTASKEITYGNTISVAGNVTAQNFIGNISITGNVQGTSANVTLVAGAYSWTFDNTGNTQGNLSLTGANITINNAPGGNEGAEIKWALPAPANTVLNTSLVQDVFQNGMRFFEAGGNNRGLYMDLGNVPNGSTTAVGYRDIPQVSFTANTTIATTDAGRHYYSTLSTGNVLTIANNASQGFQVGAAISIINQGTGNITVAQGSDVTLYLAGNATSGNRTVTTFGMATLIKVATDTWFINGTGVT